MTKVQKVLAHSLALVAFALCASAVLSTSYAAWRFSAESLSIRAPTENSTAQALTISSDVLRGAERARSGAFEWTRTEAARVPPELHLKPPKKIACRELSLALLREPVLHEASAAPPPAKLTLKIWPLSSHECAQSEQAWRLYVGNAADAKTEPFELSHLTPLEITFVADGPLEVFRALRAQSISSPSLTGAVNPFDAFSQPLAAKKLLVEAKALQLLSLTVQPASPPERTAPALEALIQANSYERVSVDETEQRWRWLWQWPGVTYLLGLLLPLAQALAAVAQLGTGGQPTAKAPAAPAGRPARSRSGSTP